MDQINPITTTKNTSFYSDEYFVLINIHSYNMILSFENRIIFYSQFVLLKWIIV